MMEITRANPNWAASFVRELSVQFLFELSKAAMAAGDADARAPIAQFAVAGSVEAQA
ncbi:MAG: hypothetical protein ACJ8C4_12395 [Gemmataceae bacterium]